MDDSLRVLGLLPLAEPYTTLGYSYADAGVNGASIPASMFNITGNDAIVDWVWIEIRDTDGIAVLEAKSAFVQRDGDVVAVSVEFIDVALEEGEGC